MIYTVTPNPALDIYGMVDCLLLNEKNYVQDVCRFAGGNGINVARVLTRLRQRCLALGFAGGAAGDEIERALSRESVQHRFIKIKDVTRSSVTVTQRKTNQQTRLSFPGPTITPMEIRKLEQQVKETRSPALLMLGGSLPGQYSTKKFRGLLTEARSRGILVTLDCPAPILKHCIKDRPTLIKPNLREFQEAISKRCRSVSAVIQEAHSLTQYVPLVCVSSVEGGAVFVSRNMAFFGKGKPINSRSCVGAGDSMVAGMLFQLEKHNVSNIRELDQDLRFVGELQTEMLRHGIAAGMATAASPAGHLGDPNDISKYLRQVSIKTLPLLVSKYGFNAA